MNGFDKPIIVPVLEGPEVEAAFDCRDYRFHRGDFPCPKDLGDSALNRTVTYKGRLVRMKNGEKVAIFDSLVTFGREMLFPSYMSVLDHINRTMLVGLLPYPVGLIADRRALSAWTKALPFDTPGVMVVEDLEPTKQRAMALPREKGSSTVERVDWISDGAGALLPFLVLKDEVEFFGKKSSSIPAGSISLIRSKGIGPGVNVISYGDWFETEGRVTPHWPSRCPLCNTPTEFKGFQLRCGKCSSKGQK